MPRFPPKPARPSRDRAGSVRRRRGSRPRKPPGNRARSPWARLRSRWSAWGFSSWAIMTGQPREKMSVERIQLLHEDYIRLTERFKALWTFHQFLRGVQKTFFASEPSYALDFGRLYDDVRAVAGTIDTTSPEKVAPRLRELSERLDAFARKLREADRHISPSYVRRFF